MKEGYILQDFIERQKKPKLLIAKEMRMTRKNLYQYFKSNKLKPEIKEKFEDYFKTKIFTPEAYKQAEEDAKRIAEIDNDTSEAPAKKDTLGEIASLLNLIHINLYEMRYNIEMNQALVKANLFQSAKLELIGLKGSGWVKPDHQRIVQDLNEVAAKFFDETHPELTRTNEA